MNFYTMHEITNSGNTFSTPEGYSTNVEKLSGIVNYRLYPPVGETPIAAGNTNNGISYATVRAGKIRQGEFELPLKEQIVSMWINKKYQLDIGVVGDVDIKNEVRKFLLHAPKPVKKFLKGGKKYNWQVVDAPRELGLV